VWVDGVAVDDGASLESLSGGGYVVAHDVDAVEVVAGFCWGHVVVEDFDPFGGFEELSVSAGWVEDGFAWGEVVEWDVLEHFDDEFGWGEYFSGCFDSLLAAVGVVAAVVHLGGDGVPHVHGGSCGWKPL